ncbi:MAG TPA: serine/threonine-protein kinase [Gammaproteobacteria bacterium]|nr:serine/threonine-protein kinase [Gammaproteobacteria bacterium]
MPVILKQLDPRNLTLEDQQLLHRFFLAEEKKAKGNKKFKWSESLPVHQFQEGNTTYSIQFTEPVYRIKKRYDRIIIQNPDSPDPKFDSKNEEVRKREKKSLYIKPLADGRFEVRAYLKEKVILSKEQLNELGFNDQDLSQPAEIYHRKKISALMSECDYVSYYYQIYERRALGGGSQGTVYSSPGKLVHSKKNSMEFIKPGTLKDSGEQRREYIIKDTDFDHLPLHKRQSQIQLSEEEARLSKELLHTKGITNIRGKSSENKHEKPQIRKKLMKQKKVKGENLQSLIDIKNFDLKTLSKEHRIQLTINLLQALKKVHDAGIIHQDIKPGNIMVDLATLEVTIIDFGLSIERNKPITAISGTPGYYSPEVFGNKDSISQKRDIYAMGLVLREIWDDKIWGIENQTRHNNEPMYPDYLYLQYQLNLSMLPPKFSNDMTQEMRRSMTIDEQNLIIKILTETTKSSPDERMSIETALSLFENLRRDDKHQEKKEEKYSAEKVHIVASGDTRNLESTSLCLMSMRKEIKISLIAKICSEMSAYSNTLDNANEIKKLLMKYVGVIRSQPYDYDVHSDLIISASQILYTVKHFDSLENANERLSENITHLESALEKHKKCEDLKTTQDELNFEQKNELETQFQLDLIAEEEKQAQLKITQQAEAKAVAKKPELPPDTRPFFEKIWQDTFLPGMNAEERKNASAAQYFFGFPTEKSSTGRNILAWSAYALGGWMVPLKNIVKFSTEFLLKGIYEGVSTVGKKLLNSESKSDDAEALRRFLLIVGALPALVIYTSAFAAHWLVRTVTSPITSAQENWKNNKLLGIASAVCSIAFWTGVAIAAAPAIGAVLGVATIGSVAGLPVLSQLAYPALWAMGQVGVAATSLVAGTVALAGAAAAVANRIGNFVTSKLARASHVKVEAAPIEAATPAALRTNTQSAPMSEGPVTASLKQKKESSTLAVANRLSENKTGEAKNLLGGHPIRSHSSQPSEHKTLPVVREGTELAPLSRHNMQEIPRPRSVSNNRK